LWKKYTAVDYVGDGAMSGIISNLLVVDLGGKVCSTSFFLTLALEFREQPVAFPTFASSLDVEEVEEEVEEAISLAEDDNWPFKKFLRFMRMRVLVSLTAGSPSPSKSPKRMDAAVANGGSSSSSSLAAVDVLAK
jgi:hypothetical protein